MNKVTELPVSASNSKKKTRLPAGGDHPARQMPADRSDLFERMSTAASPALAIRGLLDSLSSLPGVTIALCLSPSPGAQGYLLLASTADEALSQKIVDTVSADLPHETLERAEGTLSGPSAADGRSGDHHLETLLAPVVAYGKLTGAILLAHEAEPEVVDLLCRELQTRAQLAVGPILALEVERARLQYSEERQLLRSLSTALDPSIRADEVLEQVAQDLKRLLQFDRMRICTVDQKLRSCAIRFVQGTYVPGLEPGESMLYSGLPESRLTPESVQVVNATGDGVADAFAGLTRELAEGLSSFIIAPMTYRGETVGSLTFASTASGAYSSALAPMLLAIADELANFLNSTDRLAAAFEQALEKELRWRLDAEARELMRIHQERQTFMSLISHELRTPLTTVLGCAEILSTDSQANLTSRQKQCVEGVRRGANSLGRLMEDIFDLTRVQTGTFRLKNVDFDMREAISGHAQSLASTLEQKGQKLELSLPDGSMPVNGDPDRVGQVLVNLITNASKYSPNGSAIEISASASRGRCYIAVSDHGIGISREDQRKLFTPFFRADNEATRAQSGTGLGLCIAKTLVELHGGELTVESEPGKGTTVRFFIRGARAE